jgi:hypothetical protein
MPPADGSERPHRRFPIKVGRKSRPLLWLFGVRGDNAYVDLGETLDARFGWARLETPVSNIASWRIEGPWLWITAIGVRRGIRHGDFTFAGTARGGVRMDFREPVRALGFNVPALYVTVADLEGFAAALSALGIPGEDARRERRTTRPPRPRRTTRADSQDRVTVANNGDIPRLKAGCHFGNRPSPR